MLVVLRHTALQQVRPSQCACWQLRCKNNQTIQTTMGRSMQIPMEGLQGQLPIQMWILRAPLQGDALLLVNAGPATSQEMFAAAKLQNLATTWALRLFGFLLLSGGLGSLAAPCVALVEWVPLLGDLASCGALLLACGIALPLTFVTVAAAWAFYRPLFALGLLFASGVAIVVALHYQRMARRHSTSQQRAMCHYTPVAATTGPAFEYGGPPSAASTSRYGEPPPPYMESEECPGVCMQQRGGRVPMTHYSRAIEMPVPPHAVVYDTNESNLKGASGIYLDGAPSPSAPPYHNH